MRDIAFHGVAFILYKEDAGFALMVAICLEDGHCPPLLVDWQIIGRFKLITD